MSLKFLASTLSTLFLLALGVTAADWYTVEWDAPQFTALSGDMVIPKLPNSGGTPYVWPALQSDNGVLQAVCDGRSGVWWIGDGFYGTPSLPWGNGFNVNPGDTVHFSFTSQRQVGEYNVEHPWKHDESRNIRCRGKTFYLKPIPSLLTLDMQLTGIPFNFGPITYRNVKITATTPASQWCGRILHLGSYPYTVTGNTASGNTCSVASIVQNSAS
ncbi:hypothetical protein VNI00_015419 [Paramarasmius palmivorus]|uniref:Uncharacterized protein n=1 Tax=Paramarasmius palmivorus TaxID=297713 RepID=A0AAW0BIU8_9AGAR